MCLLMQETWVQSMGPEDPWGRKWLPTPVFLPGKFHGQRSLTASVHGVTHAYGLWLLRVPDDWDNLSRCQAPLYGRGQGAEWGPSPRCPSCNCVISLSCIDCAPAKLGLLMVSFFHWSTSGQHRIMSLGDTPPILTWFVCVLTPHQLNGNQEITCSSQELTFHRCQRGSYACLLGGSGTQGSNLRSIIRPSGSFPQTYTFWKPRVSR